MGAPKNGLEAGLEQAESVYAVMVMDVVAADCAPSPEAVLLGKTLEGNMMVMAPPAGISEAARKERVAVLRAALGKRSFAAIVKATLDTCRGVAGGATAEGPEGPEGVPVAGGRSWAWVPVISRMAAKQMVTGTTLTRTMFWTQRADTAGPEVYKN